MHWLVGLLLIAHGLVHSMYFISVPKSDTAYPFTFDHSFLLGSQGKTIGKILVILTIILFLLAGLAVIGSVTGLAIIWKPLVLSAAGMSLLTFVLFWHPWLILGVVLNILLILAFGVLNLQP